MAACRQDAVLDLADSCVPGFESGRQYQQTILIEGEERFRNWLAITVAQPCSIQQPSL